MLNRVKYLLYTYCIFIASFLLQKIIFMLRYWSESAQNGLSNCLKVLWHGLPMDITMAGYLSLLPLFILLISVFFNGKYFARILQVYFAAVALITSSLFLGDLVLYSFWHFKLDATVLTYITNPKGATSSVASWVVIVSVAAVLLFTYLQYFALNKYAAKPLLQSKKSGKFIVESGILILLIVPMFIGIRGGVTTSTMNVGRVYFSNNMFLNHAAVNPNFSMLSSLQYENNFDKQYRFFDDKDAHVIFNKIVSYNGIDTTKSVLNTKRPNIIFIMLESCGSVFVESLGGEKGVMPNLDKIAEEGVFFTNMYANSFRTDRGVVSNLAGYPAQPTMSIIKYPAKCQSLNSIPKSLAENGYSTSFLYGGDVDFAHVKTFFVSQKTTSITCDKDFPIKDLLSKWGAPDHITFPYLLQQIRNEKHEPYIKMYLSLSSHEPFEVPFKKFENPWLNSVAYTDSCLGVFVNELKQTPQWENTLLVIVPDHAPGYPTTVVRHTPQRHMVYCVWAGGAVKKAQRVDKICSQSDIAATLLQQLSIDHKEFIFSKDVLNPQAPQFAFYDYPNGFGVVTPQGAMAYDCDVNKTIFENGKNIDSITLQGKAWLQCLYDDIAKK